MPSLGSLQPDVIFVTEQIVAVNAEYHIAIAQRLARCVAEDIGLNRVAAYHVATAMTELASNILRHAGCGEARVREIRCGTLRGIEIQAIDQGPGIVDLTLALREGFTTAGGLGGGLPGVKRLMDELWLGSTANAGTQVVARKWMSVRRDLCAA
ncbi:Serine/threonine-protein kinase RsbT [Gammaproteobacteria bacterium]